MVMELEELEQKELQIYERKLEANKNLIQELGDRVGLEAKAKAELQSNFSVLEQKCEDQQIQIDRLKELNEANMEMMASMKKQDGANNNNNDNSNGAHGKLEYMMETNQKLVMELAQVQEDIQKSRREVSDKEKFCLELSSQLDKLATQLNTSDEQMSNYKNQLTAKQEELDAALARVAMLESSMMEKNDNPEDDNKSTADPDAERGTAVLLRALKKKEDEWNQMKRERDTSLAKATKLSLALASTREYNDSLQEKLEYQDSIVDRIVGKRRVHHNNHNSSHSPTSNHTPPPKPTPPPVTPNERTPSGGSSSGTRIRNFFNRGSGGAAAAAKTEAAPWAGNANNGTRGKNGKKTPGRTFSGRLFRRDKSASDNESSHHSTAKDEATPVKDDSNPFDDHAYSEHFINPSLGKESHIDENVQGGGGDVNLALTL